jgi:hypothetical protein
MCLGLRVRDQVLVEEAYKRGPETPSRFAAACVVSTESRVVRVTARPDARLDKFERATPVMALLSEASGPGL